MRKTIKLKNGETLDLEWNFLITEYLDEVYPGGQKQLQKDIRMNQHHFKATNVLCYAVIKANRNEPITYEDAIKSLTIKAIQDIVSFLNDNSKEMDSLKKKNQPYSKTKHKKKKH